jgi:hypothetical protein
MDRFNKIFLQKKYALLLIIVFLIIFNSPAYAYTVMETEEYKIQMFADPDPPVAKKKSGIVFKILRLKDQQPFKEGQIRVAVNEINDISNNQDATQKNYQELLKQARLIGLVILNLKPYSKIKENYNG